MYSVLSCGEIIHIERRFAKKENPITYSSQTVLKKRTGTPVTFE